MYAPPELINQTGYALKIATNVLDFYESYYGIDYPLTKSGDCETLQLYYGIED